MNLYIQDHMTSFWHSINPILLRKHFINLEVCYDSLIHTDVGDRRVLLPSAGRGEASEGVTTAQPGLEGSPKQHSLCGPG